MQHPNARMTPLRRYELILLIEEGASYREASSRLGVPISTISIWVNRWRDATDAARMDRSCLHDRSSRPRRSPRRTPEAIERTVAKVRTHTG